MTSIKSKIVILMVALLFTLGLVVTGAAILAFYNDKELTIASNNASIDAFEKKFNTEITALEKNALDLALMGEIYYQEDKRPEVGEFSTKQILKNYPHSMGNGIYFEPYSIYKDKEIACIHAFREPDGKIDLLLYCKEGRFAYLEQDWYTKMMADFQKGEHLSWSRPYKSTQLGNLMTTVGAGIYENGNLIGMSTVDWELDSILKSILEIKPTPNSFVLFADKASDYIMATTEPDIDNSSVMSKSLKTIGWYSEDLRDGVAFDYKGVKYIPYIKKLSNGMFLIVNVPVFELFHAAIHHLRILLTVLLVSALTIVTILYQTLKKNINQPISKLTEIAQKISQGDLERSIELDKPSELAELALAFNKMKTDIKNHLTELAKISVEKNRMESELAIANTIQASALPQDFPKNKFFELAASMTPAREVGGDFYDFFPLGENRMAFVIADVCGKGITAALYMMSAKTAIRSMLQAGYPLAEAINRANQSLSNTKGPLMFVTAFIGILDLQSGKIEYVNAGHCPPLLRTKNEYQYIDVIKNIVLGVDADVEFEVGWITLQENDRLFLYTDGVTEAQTEGKKFFGEDRLLETLNEKSLSLLETLKDIHQNIQLFAKGTPQSDDITMMILEFYHKK